jgi:hypothetical protein
MTSPGVGAALRFRQELARLEVRQQVHQPDI